MYGSARGRQILQYKINPNPNPNPNTNPSSPYCIMRFIFGSRVHVPSGLKLAGSVLTSYTSQDIKLVLDKGPQIQLMWSGNGCSNNSPAVYLCSGSPAHWQSQCWRAMQQLPGEPMLLPTPSMSAIDAWTHQLQSAF